MPDASYIQPSFLGGEWSPYAQGRVDNQKYKTAMNICLNTFPMEEGAAVRRPGNLFGNTTYQGRPGRVISFNFTDQAPFAIELTNNRLRVTEGQDLVLDSQSTVETINTANPCVVTFQPPQTKWATGDEVEFSFSPDSLVEAASILRNRQFTATVIDSTHVSLSDPITGVGIDGAEVAWNSANASATIGRIYEAVTPYGGGTWANVKTVQFTYPTNYSTTFPADSVPAAALLLAPSIQPTALTGISQPTNGAGFIYQTISLVDGPYLDQPYNTFIGVNSNANTVNDLDTIHHSGSVTITVDAFTWSNQEVYGIGDFVLYSGSTYTSLVAGNFNNQPDTHPGQWTLNAIVAFGPGDVGRAIRWLDEPAQWSSVGTYVAGNMVSYGGASQGIQGTSFNSGAAYYIAQKTTTGQEPDTNVDAWLPVTYPTAYTYTWGVISAVNSSISVDVTIMGNPIIFIDEPSYTWALGVYSNHTAVAPFTVTATWPTCGCWHEGRLWLAGAVPNRVDAGNSNQPYIMSPSDPSGAVGDSNGISVIFNSKDQSQIYWMESTPQGIVCGTRNGEWLISSADGSGNITPATVQAHRYTRVGCYNQVPATTPLTHVLIHRDQRLLFEYFPDVFSGRFTAPNLNTFSKHLTAGLVAELAYSAEDVPILWARNMDGTLVGWTYRRKSLFSNEEPEFVGGHRHELGGDYTVESITTLTTTDINSSPDALLQVVNDPQTSIRRVDLASRVIEPGDPLINANFLDDSVAPTGALTGTVAGVDGITLYGLWHLNGKTATAFIAGLDCGDHAVTNGSMFVPYKSDPEKRFTLNYLEEGSYLPNPNPGVINYSVPFDVIVSTPTHTPGATAFIVTEYPLPQNNVNSLGDVITWNWPAGVGYMNANSGTTSKGLRSINSSNVTEIKDATFAQIGTVYGPSTLNPWVTWGANNGYLYYTTDTTPTYLQRINANDLALQETTGLFNSFGGGSFVGFGVRQMLATNAADGSGTFLVMATVASAVDTHLLACTADNAGAGSELQLVENNPNSGTNYVMTGRNCTMVNGYPGTVYVMAVPDTVSIAPTLTQCDLYSCLINNFSGGVVEGQNISTDHLGTLFVHQIDPTWSSWSAFSGLLFDPADQTLILGVSTNDAVANKNYLVKIDISTMNILWWVPVNGLPQLNSQQQSRIVGGQYCFLSPTSVSGVDFNGTYPLYIINTLTGEYKTFYIKGLHCFVQYYDSVSGQLTMKADYLAQDGSPAPATGTPATFDHQWCRLNIGAIPPADTSGSLKHDWATLPDGTALTAGSALPRTRVEIPAVVGLTYTSRGQMLRPVLQNDLGAANGPGWGKTRRHHMAAVFFAMAINTAVSIGTAFSKLRNVLLVDGRNAALPATTLYSGVYQNTVEDDYSFDGMLCWETTRPFPTTVASVTGFINTQDR